MNNVFLDRFGQFFRATMVLALAVGTTFASPVMAMSIEVQGNAVFAVGDIGPKDILKFREAVSRPGVDTLVLVNSEGGDLYTSFHLARVVAARRLKTVVAGQCSSACAIVFMGGLERSFSDAYEPQDTYVGIHGAISRIDGKVNGVVAAQIYAFFRRNMGQRFDDDVMELAVYGMRDAGSLLRVFDGARQPKRDPYHCESSQTERRNCTDFKDHNALSLGVVTTNLLNNLKLPVEFLKPRQ
jgi:hypothetical protein